MTFTDNALHKERPDNIRHSVSLPRRQQYHPSPGDWRDEVLYFLLVDRFSDGQEGSRPLVDRGKRSAARPAVAGEPWRWDRWAESGAQRWQGGTLQGVQSKLGYLKDLGITAIWLSPVFKQRGHLDTYHGYGIQDFLEVDPRFGTRQDLVDLVAAAHAEGMRIILDVIFNHSGMNWVYADGELTPPYKAPPDRHPFGSWLDAQGEPTDSIQGSEDGVWPAELQDAERYTRAGSGDLKIGNIDDPQAEHKRTDFYTLRDFQLSAPELLADLALCYKYWIALTDCDGFRIDTLKHVSVEEAHNFCGSIKEFATNLGKRDFFLIGEIAGGDYNQDRYLDVLEHNLNAALDIGKMRLDLTNVAKGKLHPRAYFGGFDPSDAWMGSHRQLGKRHVSVLDDHDHVFGDKVRFSSDAALEHQVVAGVAMQLLTLGIPCLYYGTEQALSGPEPAQQPWLPDYRKSDRYLREAMFGPAHPRQQGLGGLQPLPAGLDTGLPGFGPYGTAGQHCFDEAHPAYVRIGALTALRSAYPALRSGRQYLRSTSFLGRPFGVYGDGELMAWSRILDDEELLCVLNPHGSANRGADVIVDANLNPPGSSMTVVLNSAESANAQPYSGTHAKGSRLVVQSAADGGAFVELREVQPSEIVVLANYPQATMGGIL